MPKHPDLTLPLAQLIIVMAAKERSNPTFEPHKAEDGTGYYVLVTWPDGRTDRIGGLFKDETAALDWIRLGSRAWIARRKNLDRSDTDCRGAIIFGDLIGKLDVLWTLRPLHPAQLAFFRHSQMRLF